MDDIYILIVVDTVATATSNSLVSNSYLGNSNGSFEAWDKEHKRTITDCFNGQTINWRVAPIDSNETIELINFKGEMINKGVCIPSSKGISNAEFWVGRMETQEMARKYRYSCELLIDGKTYQFNSVLKVLENSQA